MNPYRRRAKAQRIRSRTRFETRRFGFVSIYDIMQWQQLGWYAPFNQTEIGSINRVRFTTSELSPCV